MTSSKQMTPEEEVAFFNSVEGVDFDSFRDDASRRKAIGASRALARRLETPVDSVWTMTIQSPALYTALKVALDLNIFDKLDVPRTTQQLAGQADVDVVRRMLRHLAAMHFVKNPSHDIWAPTRQSLALQKPEVNAGIDYLYNVSGPAFMALPHYLRSIDYKNPTSGTDGNWQYVTEPGKSHFEWMAERPAIEGTFWNLMTGFASQPGTWVDVFPTESIIDNARPNLPLVVDVGE